ncbi:PilN domain-containing protein [Vitreoscilla massiliensis]|uniref:PilN domain-containing protein n=1 Tax=Vitreoscilla massiliensis TaxID=1689272 RepID=A0ABY4E4T3_9NEIS|nr:PilN domain-containing protein [Vitreoscilla massiliensis]UOO90396.1 PilN domain-containing protein [Vitreoscilla massiliensis]
MIKIVQLNLLDYRAEIQQEKLKRFKILMGAAAAVGVGLAVVAWMGLAGMVSDQQDRNTLLKGEISKLDKEIEEVKTLKDKHKNFLERKQKIEELQNKRYEAAKMIDDLNVLIPDGVYLTSIEGDVKNNYKISGKAVSDNKVALFMKNLPSTGVFEIPQLTSITKQPDAQEFVLNANLIDHAAVKEEQTAAATGAGSVLEGK